MPKQPSRSNPQENQKLVRQLKKALADRRQSVLARFPLLFTLLTTFGLVATFYGFERLIDHIDFLSANPYILLITGLLTLTLTGTLYKKLSS